jgi:hypothetical protein
MAQTEAPFVPPPPPRIYKCEGTGKLYVYGTVLNPNRFAMEVRVELVRGSDILNIDSKDGRYCFRYDDDKTNILYLRFFVSTKGGLKEDVSEIAGDRSHILNKIIDAEKLAKQSAKQAVAVETRSNPLPPEVVKARYGSTGDSQHIVSVSLINKSNSSVRVVDAGFSGRGVQSSTTTILDPNQSGSPIVIPLTDPKLVAQLAANKGAGFSLLEIGPLSVFHVSRRPSAAQVVANIYDDSLKMNEVLPANQMIQRTVFVSKALVPLSKTDAKNPKAVMDALGTFHVMAVRTDNGELSTK